MTFVEHISLYIAEATFIEKWFLFYFLLTYGSYFSLGLISAFIMLRYRMHKDATNYSDLTKHEFLPSLALIAPAYNEEVVIRQSVHSLLNMHYPDFQLVVVNDGSKDNTLTELIDEFDLYETEAIAYSQIKTEAVKAVYKSHNPAFDHLMVIDKVNGRKADAINVGINHSLAEYYSIIDLDCILEPEALLMMMEPVLKEKDQKVVAVGGVIGATNDSMVRHGKFLKEKTPKDFIPKIQVIEYMRSFLMSRPAWSKINGLLLISGALGLFERETLIAVDGYSHNSIGEDMDLVMKIHQYCLEQKINYKVEYIPYPLCWTELPYDHEILSRQRNRWMRGTIECMSKFKKMCLNPKYKVIGMISYPYWLLAEMLAPIIEGLGFLLIILFLITGLLNVPFMLLLLVFVYVLSFFFSILSISMYILCFKKYHTEYDYLSLIKCAFTEAIVYHPRVVKWAIKGYIDYFKNGSQMVWGEMTRKGFSTT